MGRCFVIPASWPPGRRRRGCGRARPCRTALRSGGGERSRRCPPAIGGSRRRARGSPLRPGPRRRPADAARAPRRRPRARPAGHSFGAGLERAGRVRRARLAPRARARSAALETRRLDREIEVEALQLPERLAELLLVPGGELRKPVVRDHEGAAPRFAEMVERDGRNLGKAEATGGEQPGMAGDNSALAVDQDRDVEAERRDAVGDAGDLAGRMQAGVAGVGLERSTGSQRTSIRAAGCSGFRLRSGSVCMSASCCSLRIEAGAVLAMFCS